MTKLFQLHPLAKIVRYSALSTCVHVRVPGIPEVGRYTDIKGNVLVYEITQCFTLLSTGKQEKHNLTQ